MTNCRLRVCSCSILAFVIVSFLSPALSAQTDRATITGLVTDPSGATVPDAKVTATAVATGVARSTVTSAQGTYTLPELPSGVYQVQVEAKGFKTTQKSVELFVLVTQRMDFRLEVGAANEVVKVTEEAPLIQADSAVEQSTATPRQVLELPLQVSSETAGRSPLSFIYLDSSVSSASGQNTPSTTNFRINGSQGLGQNILIDGGTTRRAQNGTFFTEVAPGPDVFDEFTINTGSYSSEYDNSSGGVIDFKLKSGTNNFHGELYEYWRNDYLNANTFLNNSGGLRKNEDRENDFGGNFGGPVFIPKLYNGRNKTFFFFGYGGYRFLQGQNVLVSIPTMKMRQGDFSELLTDPYVLSFFGHPIQIYDPTIPSGSRTAIPGNNLATYVNPSTGRSVIDPVGMKLLSMLPQPTQAGVFHNFLSSSTTPNDMNSEILKIDHVLTDKQRLSLSWTHRSQDAVKGGFPRFPEPLVANGVWRQFFKTDYVRIQHDDAFTPTLLNHVNLSFDRVGVINRNTTLGQSPSTVLGMNPLATQNTGLPRIGFPGYGDILTSPDPRANQEFGSSFFSDQQYENTWELSDSVTKVTGRHTLKFGASLLKEQFNVTQYLDLGSSTNFRNDQTASDADGGGGWPIASMITGAAEFSFVSIETVQPSWRYFYPAFFAQDDIKVTPKLTLNVGIRYEIPNPRTEGHDKMRAFDPKVMNPDAHILGAIVGAGGQGGLKARWPGLIPTDYSNVAPRIGFAYKLNSKTVVRGGYGLYYAPILYGFNGGSNINNAEIGYNILGFLRTPNGRNSTVFLNSYPNAPVPNPNSQFVFDSAGNFLAFNGVDYLNHDFHTGRTAQWSLDVQRQIQDHFAATLSYVGSHGTRLRSNFEHLDALPLNDLKLGFPILNESLNKALADPATVAYAASVRAPLPASASAVFPGFDGNQSVAQALRPFPQYRDFTNLMESLGHSWYDALNAKLDWRYRDGLQFGAAYTFSKLITDAAEDVQGGSPIAGSYQNPFDIRQLRSVSPNNAAHSFVLNFIYELPFGTGKPYAKRSGPIDKIAGGWEVASILSYRSGLPLVPILTGPQAGWLNLVGYDGNLRPDLTGQPILTGRQFSQRGERSDGKPGGILAPAGFHSSARRRGARECRLRHVLCRPDGVFRKRAGRAFSRAPAALQERGHYAFEEDAHHRANGDRGSRGIHQRF
ncbi:MAG: hypothetical protein DMG11_19755 [Acidobacteria bacterium]|nr:MAG: hypothetical protein DMG11_19755 [Acidobacteriota bacterium]